jgi:molecular chaperone GrpE
MAAENEKTDANGEAAAQDGSEEKAPKSSEEKSEAKGEESEAAPPDPLAEAKAEVQRFREQWMRSAADFDNFRKRTRRELEDTRKAGKEELLKEFLPVFDNLERAIQSAARAQDVKAVSDGLLMILRQFTETLGRSGISKVPTIGAQFDPTVHEAIQQVETDEHAPGTVVAEVQPGYAQGERLIRAAMVVVAKPKVGGSDDKAADEGGEGSE